MKSVSKEQMQQIKKLIDRHVLMAHIDRHAFNNEVSVYDDHIFLCEVSVETDQVRVTPETPFILDVAEYFHEEQKTKQLMSDWKTITVPDIMIVGRVRTTAKMKINLEEWVCEHKLVNKDIISGVELYDAETYDFKMDQIKIDNRAPSDEEKEILSEIKSSIEKALVAPSISMLKKYRILGPQMFAECPISLGKFKK